MRLPLCPALRQSSLASSNNRTTGDELKMHVIEFGEDQRELSSQSTLREVLEEALFVWVWQSVVQKKIKQPKVKKSQ